MDEIESDLAVFLSLENPIDWLLLKILQNKYY